MELREILKTAHAELWNNFKESQTPGARKIITDYAQFCDGKAPRVFMEKLSKSPLGSELEYSDKNALSIMLTYYLKNSVYHVLVNQMTKLDHYDYKFAYKINKERQQTGLVRYN